MRTILSPKFLLMMDIHFFIYFGEYFGILECSSQHWWWFHWWIIKVSWVHTCWVLPLGIKMFTLPEPNMAPENRVSQKVKKSSNHPFSGAMLVSGRVNSWHFLTVHLEASLSFPSKMLETFKHFNCKSHRWMINDRKMALKPSDQWWFWEMSGSMGWIATVDGSEIQRSPVEVVSLSHYLQVLFYIPGGFLVGILNHQQNHPTKVQGLFSHHHGSGKQDPGRWYSSPTWSYYHIPVPWFWEKE